MDLISPSRKNKRKPDVTFKRIQVFESPTGGDQSSVIPPAVATSHNTDDEPPPKIQRMSIPSTEGTKDENDNTASATNYEESVLSEFIPPYGKEEPPYECRLCGFTSSDKSEFLKHTLNHSQSRQLTRCPYCPFATRLPKSFQHHLLSKHDLQIPDDLLPSPITCTDDQKEKEIKCSLCSTAFSDYAQWSKHMLEFHKCTAVSAPSVIQFSPVPPLILPQPRPKQPDFFTTSQSSPIIPQNEPLNLSRSSEPITSPNEGPLDLSHQDLGTLAIPFESRCGECSYVGKSPTDLKKHEKAHCSDKRYSCGYCDRTYKYSGDLNVHLRRTHKMNTGKIIKKNIGVDAEGHVIQQSMPMMEAYYCQYCPFQATWKSEYDKHLQTHVQAKPFRCLFCDYGSRWRCDCKNHMRKHHKEKYLNNIQILNDCMRRVNKNARIYMMKGDAAKTYVDRSADVPDLVAAAAFSPTAGNPTPNLQFLQQPPTLTKMEQVVTQQVIQHSDEEGSKKLEIVEPHVDNSALAETLPVFPEAHLHPLDQVKKFVESQVLPESVSSPDSVNSSIQQQANSSIPPQMKSQAGRGSKLIPHKGSDDFYYCPRCQYKARTLDKIEVHIASHSDLKIFKCSACGKRANWKWDVRKHIDTKHAGAGDIIMLDVNTAKDTLHQYLQSEEHVLRYMRIPRKKELSEQNAIAPQITPEVKKNDTRPYQCGVCDRKSNWRWDIMKHARFMHPHESIKIIDTRLKTGDSESGQRLPEIGKGKNALSKWRSRLGIKIHKCPACPYRSNWYSDVFRHIRMQHKVKAGVVILDEAEAQRTLAEYELWHMQRKERRVSRPTTAQRPKAHPRDAISETALLEVAAQTDSKQREALQPLYVTESRSWRCRICQFSHRNHHVVRLHCLTHRDMAYKCAFCHYSSNHKSSVYRHGVMKHPVEYHSTGHPTKCILNNPKYDPALSQPSISAAQKPSTVVAYKCNLCMFTTKSISHATRHLKSIHSLSSPGHFLHKRISQPAGSLTTDQIRKCSLCPFSTYYLYKIDLHKKHHDTSAGNLKCEKCDYYARSKKGIDMHAKVHCAPSGHQKLSQVSEKKSSALAIYKCKQCDFRAKLKKTMVEHYSVHGQDLRSQNLLAQEIASLPQWRTKYKCEKCPFVAAYRPYLHRHMEFHQPREGAIFQCRVCDYSASLKRILSKHEKLHRRADPFGDLSLPTMVNFRSTNATQIESDMENQTHADPNLKCTGCDYQASSRMELFAHIKSQHISELDDGSSSSGSTGQISPFFDNNENIVVKHHQYKKYACSKCPYRAVSMQLLERHEQLHGSGQMYHCQYCDYSVSKRHLIVKHEAIHFQTEDGNQSRPTVRSTSSLIHESKAKTISENQQIFKRCPHCPFVALTTQTLTNHLQYHGTSYELRCFTCDFCVPQADWLADHMALHLLADCSTNSFLSSALKESAHHPPEALVNANTAANS